MYLMLAGASDGVGYFCGGPLDSDVIRAPRDVLIAPFNHQDVLSFLLQLVGHIIETVTQVFHQNLLTGHFGSVHSNQEHVPPCGDIRKYIVKCWQLIGTDCMFDANNPSVPALLQSTLKVFFCPMKPLLSPRPLATTRLASELAHPGAACWLVVTLRVTGSTRTDEVSCMLWLLTNREPAKDTFEITHD